MLGFFDCFVKSEWQEMFKLLQVRDKKFRSFLYKKSQFKYRIPGKSLECAFFGQILYVTLKSLDTVLNCYTRVLCRCKKCGFSLTNQFVTEEQENWEERIEQTERTKDSQVHTTQW